MTNILFICRHNCFRSKIAEAYFNKINPHKSISVRGAGLFPGVHTNSSQARVAKSLGVFMKGKPHPITIKLLHWADILVVVADNIPSELFKKEEFKGKLIVWKVRDAHANNPKDIARAVKEIIQHINKFVKTL